MDNVSETLTDADLAQWLRHRAKHSADREKERLLMAADTIERKEIQDEQDARSKAEQQRDAALAEVERYQNSFAEGRARWVHRA